MTRPEMADLSDLPGDVPPADEPPAETAPEAEPADDGPADDGTVDDGPPAAGAGPGRRRLRFGTIVLGLLLAVVAVTVWVGRVLERQVSVGAVATAAMIGAGALLLVGAMVRPDRPTDRPTDRP